MDLSGCTLSQTVTTMQNMCNGCSKFTKTPISVIPDTCTNISYLFANSGITDISGMTFGTKISNMTSWIPPNLTTANNITIKNNNVKFNGCNTLISCDNFVFTGTSMNWMFNNCGKLQSVKNFTTNSKVINYTGLFGNCGSLGEVDFINIDFTSATTINHMIQGLKNGAVIKNIKFGSNLTASGMDSWMRGNLKNIENIYIPTNTVAVNFKGNNDLSGILNNISGVTFSTNVTDITGMLSGANKIKEDFVIPSHITNCTNCFKGCTSITHVHSNWDKTYTNGITSTDCYAGCTAITHIDDKNIVTYEGKEGLDEIPVAWGGLELMAINTYVLKFEIPSDNFTLKFSSYEIISGKNTVSWGDKTYTNGVIEHTYVKAGTYIVKSQLRMAWSGTWVDNSVMESLVEICQFPTTRLQHAFGFGQCTKLVKANLTNANIFFFTYFFNGCSALEEVIFTNATITGRADSVFSGCTSLKGIDLSTVDFVGVDNLVAFLSRCSSLRYFYAPKNINVSMSNFTESIYLTSEHLMSIINNLNTVSTTQTLTIGSTNLAKLTPEQIKVATDKNWTVV